MEIKKLPVIRVRWFAVAFSATLLIVGLVVGIISGGFNLGIDFESGLSLRVQLDEGTPIAEVRKTLEILPGGVRVQNVGDSDNGVFQLRMSAQDGQKETESRVVSLLENKFGGNVTVLESNFIGAKFSSDLISGSLFAIAIALVLILIYIWVRFRLCYACAAVLGLVHDVSLLISFILFARIEVSSTIIAAVLTIIGYCLNNTIVIFDRIRENVELKVYDDFATIVDVSVAQSLKRTLFSSLTTLAAVLPLAIFATGDIKLFAICLSFGICIGTYSSNFISPNFLAWIGKIPGEKFDPMFIPEKEDKEKPKNPWGAVI